MSQRNEKTKIKGRSKFIAVLGVLLLLVASSASYSLAQRQPPQTPIGELNGKPIYADDVLNGINNDSPFMPALEDDKLNSEPTSSPSDCRIPPSLSAKIRTAYGAFPDFGLMKRAKLIFGKPAIIRTRFCSFLTATGWQDSSLSDTIYGRIKAE